MFNALREGGTFYILRKGSKDSSPILRIGQITKKSDPVTAMGSAPQPFGLPVETFVDIEVRAGDETYKFDKLSSNESMRFYQAENTFITDSRDIVTQEFETMCQLSTQALETMPYHQSVIDARDEIMCQLNPQLAKEKAQEEKIGALESKICGVETTLCSIQEMLSEALNGRAGSRKSNNSNNN